MKTTYKIEKGIPITIPSHSVTIYPFKAMNVGDSFLVPLSKKNSVRTSASNYTKRHPGFKMVSRRAPGGLRCWCKSKGVSL
jgi:hypothetical protein